MGRVATAPDPPSPRLTVTEATDLRVVHPSACPTCGSTPTARPLVHEERGGGATCSACGSPIASAAARFPPMGRRQIWRDYEAPLDEVRRALEAQVAEMGHHLLAASDDRRVVFRTGMSMFSWAGHTMTAELQALGPLTRVVMSGRLHGPQIYAWGEAEAIARRVFHGLDRSPRWVAQVRDGNLRDPLRIWLNLAFIVPFVLWAAYLFLR